MTGNALKTETIRLGDCILGVVRWSDTARTATFVAYNAKLNPLEARSWECPVQARNEIQGYAKEAGIA